METVYLAPSFKCMHRCVCCPLDTKQKMEFPMELEAVTGLVDELQNEGKDGVNIILSGGEPMLYKHFFEVLKYISDRRIALHILSTSEHCADKRFVDKIVDSVGENIGNVSISSTIYSMDEKIHDGITKVPGSLDKTLLGLSNLLDAGIEIKLKHVMSKPALETMPKTFVELDKYFPDSVDFHICSMDYQGRCKKNAGMLFAGFREIQPYLEETLDLFDCYPEKSARKVSVFETPLCAVDPYYWKFFLIKNGDVNEYVSAKDKISNPVQACRADYQECDYCDVSSYCNGVWKSAYELGKDMDGFISPVKSLM